MENKKYSLRELTKFNKTYNEIMYFLKGTIPEEKRPEILEKFEKRALEDDDRSNGLKWMLNINGLATATSLMAVMLGNFGTIGATVVTAPYTLLYYLWCKHTMLEGKDKKEECLRFMQSISEKEHNIRYPFSIGNYEDLDKMQKYSKLIKDMNGEDLANYFREMYEDKSL